MLLLLTTNYQIKVSLYNIATSKVNIFDSTWISYVVVFAGTSFCKKKYKSNGDIEESKLMLMTRLNQTAGISGFGR